MTANNSSSQRPRYPMPEFIKEALENSDLMDEYNDRPAYQQNDYIWWINQAKRMETRDKRLNQMLNELKKGGVYMNMEHRPSRKDKNQDS